MAQETRIYVVVDRGESADDPPLKSYLVRAGNPAQAARHITRNRFKVDVASQDDLVRLMTAGVTVEASGDEA